MQYGQSNTALQTPAIAVNEELDCVWTAIYAVRYVI